MSDKTKQREIKFRVMRDSARGWEDTGIERIGKDGWEWRCYELDPDPDDKGVPRERWTRGVYPNSPKYIRNQFTGLHDKNGKEIYEGDVCWTYEHGVGNLLRVVEFKDGSFVFTHPHALTTELRGWKTDYMEVKGDIYRNPELLQK